MGFHLPKKSNKKRVIWLHAASAGELRGILPILPLLKENLYFPILLSLGSQWGYEYANKRKELIMPYVDKIFFLPIDVNFIIKRLILTLNPKLLILTESELYPNLLILIKNKLEDAKIILINGAISNKTFNIYYRIRRSISLFLSKIDYFYVQNNIYKDRFLNLGIEASKIEVIGNTKFSPIDENKEGWVQLSSCLSSSSFKDNLFIITAGSIRDEEIDFIFNTFCNLLEYNSLKEKNILLILAPRYPTPKLINYLVRKRKDVFIASDELITNPSGLPARSILLVDKFGELSSYYKISNVCIVGGSFHIKFGGHNILEPTILGKIVIFGPYLKDNYRELADMLISNRCGIQFSSGSLAELIKKTIEDYDRIVEEAKDGIKKIQNLFKELPQKYVKLIKEHI